MSYDLAVWEGDRPADDAAAAEVFSELYERYIETDVTQPQTPAIKEFITDLLTHWPDLTVDNIETSPWTVSGMTDSARGPLAYFSMNRSMAAEPSAYAAGLANAMGLVCYDPQARQLRT
jgi:hypothetical protein